MSLWCQYNFLKLLSFFGRNGGRTRKSERALKERRKELKGNKRK
jgi:hypothetical protein